MTKPCHETKPPVPIAAAASCFGVSGLSRESDHFKEKFTMAAETMRNTPDLGATGEAAHGVERPVGQVVLVMQGGGALGAYQAGVYQALTEAQIEPDWVVGTSIGAINAAIIAGNDASIRLERLRAFWERLSIRSMPDFFPWPSATQRMMTVMAGLSGFFTPIFGALAIHRPVGLARAAFYSTEPLRETLGGLIDFERLNTASTRLTVGAVNVLSGEMQYFDSRDRSLSLEHVMASGALPPAFPAVRIGDDYYWDGGIYSNTPLEVVLDDNPRRDSLIFTVNMWQPGSAEPSSIWHVMERQKDIQFASRAKSHILRQAQIHKLRHVIRQLTAMVPLERRNDPDVATLANFGCATTMHLVRLLAPSMAEDDLTKDIDFSERSIAARWSAGYAHATHVLREKPWQAEVSPLQGVVVHEFKETTA